MHVKSSAWWRTKKETANQPFAKQPPRHLSGLRDKFYILTNFIYREKFYIFQQVLYILQQSLIVHYNLNTKIKKFYFIYGCLHQCSRQLETEDYNKD